MRYANQPLNKPLDVTAPIIKQALCGLLWEEIRPVQQLELTWTSDARHQPAPEELAITTLNNQGASSSWWNNLTAAKKSVTPTVSSDGKTYVYLLGVTPELLSVSSARMPRLCCQPTARVLVAENGRRWTWRLNGFDHRCGEGLQRTGGNP